MRSSQAISVAKRDRTAAASGELRAGGAELLCRPSPLPGWGGGSRKPPYRDVRALRLLLVFTLKEPEWDFFFFLLPPTSPFFFFFKAKALLC